MQAPVVSVMANVGAAPLSDPAAIRASLVAQVTGTVRWRECVEAMAAAELAVNPDPKRSSFLYFYARELVAHAWIVHGTVHEPASGGLPLAFERVSKGSIFDTAEVGVGGEGLLEFGGDLPAQVGVAVRQRRRRSGGSGRRRPPPRRWWWCWRASWWRQGPPGRSSWWSSGAAGWPPRSPRSCSPDRTPRPRPGRSRARRRRPLRGAGRRSSHLQVVGVTGWSVATGSLARGRWSRQSSPL